MKVGDVWWSGDHRNARARYLLVVEVRERSVLCRRYCDAKLTRPAGTVAVSFEAMRVASRLVRRGVETCGATR